ncbi:MAG: suppressor of fused domain protein [Bacteroidota bacterium]
MKFFKKIFSSNQRDFSDPEILLEENSPLSPITAVVEQDERVAYFYLWGPEGSRFGMKACWIRNLSQAPTKRDEAALKASMPPMLPAAHCKFPQGQEKLKKDKLRIVWLEEGDGAALYEGNKLLAAIPSWGGMGGFSGYARDCIGQNELAWEFSVENVFPDRVKRAEEFWASWDKENNPFAQYQSEFMQLYEEYFGESDTYFALDGEQGPPKGLYVRKGEQKFVFASLGMALFPMPQVEMYTERPGEIHRIELACMLSKGIKEEDVQSMANYFGGQTSLPWDQITFLGEGHTILFPLGEDSGFSAVLLTNTLSVLPKVELPDYRSSKVNLLWMIPITEAERKYALEKGSESLKKKLDKLGDEVFSLERKSTIKP